MKLKKLMAGVMVGIMAFSMAACSGGSAETEGSETQQQSDASGESKTVGISMPTQSLERWNRDGSYLKQQFESKGYTVELTYSDNKIDQQVKDIEGLIAGEIDLLVIAAIDGQALSQVLKDAKDLEIPVISYDRLINNTDAISYYVSFDNYKSGTAFKGSLW